MKGKKTMKNRNTYEAFKKIRKIQPPVEKIIRPKNEFYKRERFDWKKEQE